MQSNTKLYPWPGTGESVTVDHIARACWTAGSTQKIEATADSDLLVGSDVFEEAVLLATRLRVLEDTDEVELRDTIQARLQLELVKLRDAQLNIVGDDAPEIEQTQVWH